MTSRRIEAPDFGGCAIRIGRVQSTGVAAVRTTLAMYEVMGYIRIWLQVQGSGSGAGVTVAAVCTTLAMYEVMGW